MNFVFISPHFPKHYWNFCDRLHKNGVNVLGIGDCPYDALDKRLKDSLFMAQEVFLLMLIVICMKESLFYLVEKEL